jgi:hypothetical protein
MSIEEKPKFISPYSHVLSEEQKIRLLAVEMAKNIIEPLEIMEKLGISQLEFDALKSTHAFQTMYQAALIEWLSAGNTQKRVKFKSAAITEDALAIFYDDIKNKSEPLSSRVELLKTLARFGGIGAVEPPPPGGNGQFFKLEIHLSGSKTPIIVGSGPGDPSMNSGQELIESDLAKGEPDDDF